MGGAYDVQRVLQRTGQTAAQYCVVLRKNDCGLCATGTLSSTTLMGYVGIFVATLISNALFGAVSWKWFSVRLANMTKMIKTQAVSA